MSAPKPWFLLPGLAALARNIKQRGRTFTAQDLSRWADTEQIDYSLNVAKMALDTMAAWRYVQLQNAKLQRKRIGAINVWVLTESGWAATKAALRAMPGGPPQGTYALELDVRLWNLLRIRRKLTADEAAQTLVDASAADYPTLKKRIAALLAAWAKYAPKAVGRGVRREPGGHVRFVLYPDNKLGRWPPPTKAGEMHPSAFSNTAPVPSNFLKASGSEEHV